MVNVFYKGESTLIKEKKTTRYKRENFFFYLFIFIPKLFSINPIRYISVVLRMCKKKERKLATLQNKLGNNIENLCQQKKNNNTKKKTSD